MRSKSYPPRATFESAWALIQKNAIENEKLRESINKMQEENEKERKERQKESEKEWKELKASIKATQKEIGGIAHSNGEVAESYFVNSFGKHLQFAGQEYDSLVPNLIKKSKSLNIQGEYDLVLYNCTSIAIIEIKYKARKEDVEALLNKAPTFKQLFPEYENYDMYLGLAGLHVNITAEKEAVKQGIGIIKQVGNAMVINDAHLKNYKQVYLHNKI
jgi:hypothetical protein